MVARENGIWISPQEWTVVIVVWLALFGGSLLLGAGVLWRRIRDRRAETRLEEQRLLGERRLVEEEAHG